MPARSGGYNPALSLVLAYMEAGSRPVGAKQGGGAGRAWWPGWGRGAFLVRAPLVAGAFPVPVAGGWCVSFFGGGVGFGGDDFPWWC